MLIIIEQYIYVCVYAYTHKYVHPLPGINTTVVDSPSRIFILLFIYKIKLVAFLCLSCLTEIPTLTKTHTRIALKTVAQY